TKLVHALEPPMYSQKSSSSGHTRCFFSRLQLRHTRSRPLFRPVLCKFSPSYGKIGNGHDQAEGLNNFKLAGSAASSNSLWPKRQQRLHTRCACGQRGGKSPELHDDAVSTALAADPLDSAAGPPVGHGEGHALTDLTDDRAASGGRATISSTAGAAAVDAVASSDSTIAQPEPFLSRRRALHLTAMLIMTLLPLPVPVVTEPSCTRTRTQGGLLLAPSLVGAPSAAAAMAPLTNVEPQPSSRALGAGGIFCYVSAEPPDGMGSALPAPSPLHFRTLAAAAATCPSGGVVLVVAGRYRERLQLSQPVTLRAWPNGARVEVVWETSEPYQSTLEVNAPAAGRGEVVVEGISIRHSSKSVANNYGVYIRGGSPRLVDCDISSATGAGVGIEGANPQLVGCRIHDCARQGIAVFGSSYDFGLDPAVDPGLMYGMTGGLIRDCDIYGNKLDGVLVRSGASPDLLDNLIHNNAGFGANLQDCSGRYEHNTVYDNARGSVAVSALFDLDPGDLAGSNSLRGLMRRL
ncbi:hypothetical protein VaNZ11_014948, partial [Volvox africanus]